MKELCEARAKLEMSSNLALLPWGGKSADTPLDQPRVNFKVSSDFQIWQIYLGITEDGPPS